MLWNPKHELRAGSLEERVQQAERITPDLMSAIMAEARDRLPVLSRSREGTVRLAHLIECAAWTDAALAVIDLELPDWQLRRLVREDGQWLCSLSRQPNLPPELDETIDGTHEVLSLAILGALMEARRRTSFTQTAPSAAAAPTQPAAAYSVCCDNFA